MSQKSTKVERLVRLRKFREELAEGDLRQALAEHGKAVVAQDAAQATLEELGAWKARRAAEGNLDLGVYQVVLAMEQRGVQQVDALRAQTETRREQAEQSRRRLGDAAASTRVAERRDLRERVAQDDRDEKRQFDHLSEQWLGQRGSKK